VAALPTDLRSVVLPGSVNSRLLRDTTSNGRIITLGNAAGARITFNFLHRVITGRILRVA